MQHHHQNGGNGDTHQIWKTAPVLIGTTQFEPRTDVRNIMVTGGAGFMYVSYTFLQLSHTSILIRSTTAPRGLSATSS